MKRKAEHQLDAERKLAPIANFIIDNPPTCEFLDDDFMSMNSVEFSEIIWPAIASSKYGIQWVGFYRPKMKWMSASSMLNYQALKNGSLIYALRVCGCFLSFSGILTSDLPKDELAEIMLHIGKVDGIWFGLDLTENLLRMVKMFCARQDVLKIIFDIHYLKESDQWIKNMWMPSTSSDPHHINQIDYADLTFKFW